MQLTTLAYVLQLDKLALPYKIKSIIAKQLVLYLETEERGYLSWFNPTASN